jgi:hypothetical protein
VVTGIAVPMAAIENNAVIIFDNGERKNVQSSVEQIKNEISGVTTHIP